MNNQEINELKLHLKFLERQNKALCNEYLDKVALGAMSAILYGTQKDWNWIPSHQHAEIAKQAYSIADAMLHERTTRIANDFN